MGSPYAGQVYIGRGPLGPRLSILGDLYRIVTSSCLTSPSHSPVALEEKTQNLHCRPTPVKCILVEGRGPLGPRLSLAFTCFHLCSLVFSCFHLSSLVFSCFHIFLFFSLLSSFLLFSLFSLFSLFFSFFSFSLFLFSLF